MPLLALIVLLSLVIGQPASQPAQATGSAACRFGITSVYGSNGYDIDSIGVGSYMDWASNANPDLPAGMEYVRTLRLRDDLYADTLSHLPGWIEAYPGSVWLAGNEPDTTYGGQDALTAEIYAERFHEVADIIRANDLTAKIGFGTIVQPTPIRMRYLDHAWTRLIQSDLAGSVAAASALIDIWSIHSFILNEWPDPPNNWGTGVPPGFESDYSDAITIGYPYTDTYSITLFQQRIEAFRTWMAGKGEQNKPLWITEYGSLFPSDPSAGYVTVLAVDTKNYMLATFDYLLAANNSTTGMASDGNRLVQRWFWYSLNDHLNIFGGSLFDPDKGKSLTPVVGTAFKAYQNFTDAQPDLFPTSVFIYPVNYAAGGTLVNYRLNITIGNDLSADTGSTATVNIYVGGTQIADPISTPNVQRCGGRTMISAEWQNVTPLQDYTVHVEVASVGVVDKNLANNAADFIVYTDLPKQLFLPLITRR